MEIARRTVVETERSLPAVIDHERLSRGQRVSSSYVGSHQSTSSRTTVTLSGPPCSRARAMSPAAAFAADVPAARSAPICSRETYDVSPSEQTSSRRERSSSSSWTLARTRGLLSEHVVDEHRFLVRGGVGVSIYCVEQPDQRRNDDRVAGVRATAAIAGTDLIGDHPRTLRASCQRTMS